MIREYEERASRFGRIREEAETTGLKLGWIRLFVFGLGCLFYLGWDVLVGPAAQVSGVAFGLTSLVFVFLVVRHRRVRALRRWYETLESLNRTSLARAARNWAALPPSPMEDPACGHAYAADLDICGEASLFRLLNTVTLPPGVETLRDWLLSPANPEEVRKRQEAVAELAPKLDFRQTLEGKGRLTESPTLEHLRQFLEWAEGASWIPRHNWVRLASWVLPVASAVLLGLFWRGTVAGPWWLLTMGAALGLGSILQLKIHPLMARASAGQERFGRYASLLSLLLEENLEAPALRELQGSVKSSPVGAELELRRLGRRVGWADVRLSTMAHAPLQALFLWDVHVLASLERWKRRSGPHVRDWLEVLGKLEALSALASLKGDHPEWCFPEISEGGSTMVKGRDLGHPLLPSESCVRNDVEIGPPGTFLFVTGSNMSGKSTLLRAVGINSVLAQAGGPACAEALELEPVRVQTSMRTADSLSEGVSQYMAELNRIRQVVEEARGAELGTVLYLLDEPLQGTNEAERRVAVQTILGHLLEAGAIGAVATHDLYLDETDRLKSAAKAVHLEGTVREGDSGPLLSFDYRLKPGRATSTNALALLRAVGLGGGEEARDSRDGIP